ncbi:MAG: hypothetical protein IJ723_05915, partial [Ruminococcus sp.]|nr:hypothetical protein [Ruminococcus sp.]
AFSGALILLVRLCVQKLITGALLFTRREHGRAVVWLLALAGIITTSGMYIAGYAAISRLSLFSISGSSARLLTYSYSCAFFGVMSVVFTVTDTLLLSKRAEV